MESSEFSVKNVMVEKIKKLLFLISAIRVSFLYVIINTIISAIITALYMTTDIKLAFKQDFITLISFIVSLLISARTSTAYNRYLDGQNLWAKLKFTALNMARFIRINIDTKQQRENFITLLICLIISIKDYLQFDSIERRKNKVGKNDNIQTKGMRDIIEHINKIDETENNDKECLSGLEKIDSSPIPFAYSTLLSVTAWIFSLSLSFQLVSDLQWLTVPIIFLSTLFLFGIIEIAKEIENPFGIDASDLTLEKFCEEIWDDTKFMMDIEDMDINNVCIEELENIKKVKEYKETPDDKNV
ncbi:4568_t:CDS:2 [Dentiscutata heterogama]|uniref:4568_t:CDS:1 n=1 Tax=Dentiscutata heterogama TaxID=1316150 RepID=A0ACA9K7X9_9GLOM|nr:4568_t:CDS:2 [Dentiscutata heterogama]